MTVIIVYMKKLTEFMGRQVSFIETLHVKKGVVCDTYSFVGDSSKDLGVITVSRDQTTPRQRIVQGSTTIEGYLSGHGTLTIKYEKGETKTYTFGKDSEDGPVDVEIGQIVQLKAAHDSDLVFYEICEPPYQDGRFENLD